MLDGLVGAMGGENRQRHGKNGMRHGDCNVLLFQSTGHGAFFVVGDRMGLATRKNMEGRTLYRARPGVSWSQ